MSLADRRLRNVKRQDLASVAENNKRECTISQQESALFTFKTTEKRNLFLREVSLFT